VTATPEETTETADEAGKDEAPVHSAPGPASDGSGVDLPAPPALPKTSDRPDDASQVASPPILPDSPKGTVLWRVRGMLRTLRPQQWVKNIFVLAPVVFSKHLTHESIITRALGAFGIFCLLAGAVYTINDIVDADADRAHPVKRSRPIASGRVPLHVAKIMAAVLVVISLAASMLGGPWFVLVTCLYFGQNLAYSFGLKKLAYVDVGIIAAGFVLRVLAGGFATLTPLSGYMIACTAVLALFLGFGKRRHELASAVNAKKQRAALGAYTPRALNIALGLTGAAAIGTYLAYTLDQNTRLFFKSDWLWLTTIHVVFGVVRFLQLVAGRPRAESPTQEMLRDTPFVLNLILFVIEVVAILYRLRPS